MLRRGLVALALSAAMLGVGGVPAHAIVPGDTLTVIAYYSDASKTTLVGQKWSGCGQPSGSWGTTSSYSNLYFTPC